MRYYNKEKTEKIAKAIKEGMPVAEMLVKFKTSTKKISDIRKELNGKHMEEKEHKPRKAYAERISSHYIFSNQNLSNEFVLNCF